MGANHREAAPGQYPAHASRMHSPQPQPLSPPKKPCTLTQPSAPSSLDSMGCALKSDKRSPISRDPLQKAQHQIKRHSKGRLQYLESPDPSLAQISNQSKHKTCTLTRTRQIQYIHIQTNALLPPKTSSYPPYAHHHASVGPVNGHVVAGPEGGVAPVGHEDVTRVNARERSHRLVVCLL